MYIMNTFANTKHQTNRTADPSKIEILTQCTIYQTTQQTFATRRSIVFPARWAIAACSAALRVSAFPFAVASAVLLETLVHVYTYK